MKEVTEKQATTIKQLREKVKEIYKGDEYLLSDGNLSNWLEYKNWKVEKAEKAIIKNIKWRQDNKIDEIMHEDFGDFYNSLVYYQDGEDKEGRPVLCGYIAQVDLKKALDIYLADKEKGERHSLYRSEVLFDLVKKAHARTDGKVNSVVAIVDFKDVKLKPFMSKLIELVPRGGALAKQLEKNYPGLMEKTYVINAPGKVSTLWSMAHAWKEVILKEIDADQIRERFSGSIPDGPTPVIKYP